MDIIVKTENSHRRIHQTQKLVINLI